DRVLSQRESKIERWSIGPVELLQQLGIPLWINDDEDVAEIFRRRPNHAGAADVDLLDQFVEAYTTLFRRLGERIQIHDNDIDELDPVLGDGLQVTFMIAPRQTAAVPVGVQRFHAPV